MAKQKNIPLVVPNITVEQLPPEALKEFDQACDASNSALEHMAKGFLKSLEKLVPNWTQVSKKSANIKKCMDACKLAAKQRMVNGPNRRITEKTFDTYLTIVKRIISHEMKLEDAARCNNGQAVRAEELARKKSREGDSEYTSIEWPERMSKAVTEIVEEDLTEARKLSEDKEKKVTPPSNTPPPTPELIFPEETKLDGDKLLWEWLDRTVKWSEGQGAAQALASDTPLAQKCSEVLGRITSLRNAHRPIKTPSNFSAVG